MEGWKVGNGGGWEILGTFVENGELSTEKK